MKTLFPAF